MKLLYFLLLIVIVNAKQIHIHSEQDEVEFELFEIDPLPLEEQHEYAKENNNWRNMKIYVDFTHVNGEYKEFIQELVQQALDYLSSVYKVFPTQQIDEIKGRSHCGSQLIPEDQQKHGLAGYDLVVYVGVKYMAHQSWLAAASPCYLSKRNRRPVAGNIVINSWYVSKVDLKNLDGVNSMNWLGIVTHELTHNLGFTSALFRHYLQNVVGTWEGRNWIVAENVVNYGKQYYNCSTLKGLPLENNGNGGTRGSHWEKTTFGNELMTGEDVIAFSYSLFTIMTLESSKWYIADHSKAYPFTWGMGQGCPTPEGQCQGDEFCPRLRKRGQVCDESYYMHAGCFTGFLSPKCGLWTGMASSDCRWLLSAKQQSEISHVQSHGGNSRCWNLNGLIGCFQSECLPGGGVRVSVGGTNYTCESGQETVSVGKQLFECPNEQIFCAYDASLCQDSCNGRGKCLNGVCQCYLGFKGDTCAQLSL